MKDVTDYFVYELENDGTPAPAVTVLADLNYDYIYDSPPLTAGKEVFISGFTRNLAGAGGYVSCGLARLGAVVHLLTELGDDDDGRSLREGITAAGVRPEGIRLVPGERSAFTLIFTGESERTPRQVATFPGTSARMSTRTIDYRSWVERSRLVYSCNYFILRRLREEIGPVFRYARALGALTAYDANAGDGWENERKLATLKERIYPATDIVFLNEDEARHLAGRRDPLEHIEGICPDAATLIVKLGPRGSIARHRGRVYRTGAFPLDGKARDTIGAGDSFQAAFLFFLLKKLPIELCLVLGTANAASTVMYRGGTEGQLDVKGLISFVKKYRVLDGGNGGMEMRER